MNYVLLAINAKIVVIVMMNDRRNFSRVDAFRIFWIIGCSSVLLDLDHIWKILGLEAPFRLTYFAGREFHTTLVFIILGCLFSLCFSAYADRQGYFGRNVGISRKRINRDLSSLRTSFYKCDNSYNYGESDILLVSGSGGHLQRALALRRYFKNATIVIPYESELSKHKVKRNYIRVISPRFKAKSNRFVSVFRTLWLFIHAIVIIAMVRPKIVISTGSGLSLPVLLIARFFRVKTVYIESPSRLFEPSITGKFMMGKTNAWIALWPELAVKYGVKYGGMLS